jgi:hypothetical protein
LSSWDDASPENIAAQPKTRISRDFVVSRSRVRPGTFVRMESRDWIVIEIQQSDAKPAVICRLAPE